MYNLAQIMPISADDTIYCIVVMKRLHLVKALWPCLICLNDDMHVPYYSIKAMNIGALLYKLHVYVMFGCPCGGIVSVTSV